MHTRPNSCSKRLTSIRWLVFSNRTFETFRRPYSPTSIIQSFSRLSIGIRIWTRRFESMLCKRFSPNYHRRTRRLSIYFWIIWWGKTSIVYVRAKSVTFYFSIELTGYTNKKLKIRCPFITWQWSSARRYCGQVLPRRSKKICSSPAQPMSWHKLEFFTAFYKLDWSEQV